MRQDAKKKKTGKEVFEEYYASLFGGRWTALRKSLSQENVYIKLDMGGSSPYFLDPASICAALSLDVTDAESVADLCAAPGGKSLVISGTKKEEASLFSNERSAQRKMRLVKSMDDVLPEKFRKSVTCAQNDAAVLCRKMQECFDSILLDVPCSSERHVLNDEKYLSVWSPSRIKTLSMEQWALASSAWRLLNKGGFLLYSTCALNPLENENTVTKLLKKFDDARLVPYEQMRSVFVKNLDSFKGRFSSETADAQNIIKNVFSSAEKKEAGLHVLPDSSDGAGPLYFCLIQKAAG